MSPPKRKKFKSSSLSEGSDASSEPSSEPVFDIFEKFNNDILLFILGLLSLSDICVIFPTSMGVSNLVKQALKNTKSLDLRKEKAGVLPMVRKYCRRLEYFFAQPIPQKDFEVIIVNNRNIIEITHSHFFQIRNIDCLHNLERLCAGVPFSFCPSHLQPFTNLTALTLVSSIDFGFSVALDKVLSFCPSLHDVGVHRMNVTFSDNQTFPKIHMFLVDECEITDADCKYFARCLPNVRILSLKGNEGVTDAGVRWFSRCDELCLLSLQRTSVTKNLLLDVMVKSKALSRMLCVEVSFEWCMWGENARAFRNVFPHCRVVVHETPGAPSSDEGN